MGDLNAEEKARQAADARFKALDIVVAFEEAVKKFIVEELAGQPVEFNAEGMNKAGALFREFADEIWPHKMPQAVDFWNAVKAGREAEFVAQANAEFAAALAAA